MRGNAHAQEFRNNLREQDCARLDVWIGGAWVRGLVFLANHEKRPLWKIVQDIVKSHITKIGFGVWCIRSHPRTVSGIPTRRFLREPRTIKLIAKIFGQVSY